MKKKNPRRYRMMRYNPRTRNQCSLYVKNGIQYVDDVERTPRRLCRGTRRSRLRKRLQGQNTILSEKPRCTEMNPDVCVHTHIHKNRKPLRGEAARRRQTGENDHALVLVVFPGVVGVPNNGVVPAASVMSLETP